MAILLCLATIWFRPAAILLELDFLSLCLETRALRNTYLDHLQLLRLRGKGEKRLEARFCSVCLNMSWYVFVSG